jgi:3-oxoacyl-[acyl-carrier protein] reductase
MLSVIVTGGSRGLGLAIANSLTHEGYSVIVVARSMSIELSGAIAGIQSRSAGRLSFVAADLSKTDEIPSLISRIRKEFGEIYGLVNNAGIGTDGILVNMNVSRIRELVQLNTLSPIILSKFVLKSMLAAGTGRIVNISSIVSCTGYSGLAVYAATKSSMIGFTRSLAREVGRLGITVNAVAPGFIETDMTQSVGQGDLLRIARRSALQRLAVPKDVAEAVKFLLGESGRNITGTVLTVDAGNTA